MSTAFSSEFLRLRNVGVIADPGVTGQGHLAVLADSVRRDPGCLRTYLLRVRDAAGASAGLHRARLAERSYLHPNGFAKIVLGHGQVTGTTYRLHVWDVALDDEPRGETEPHGHRWAFASTVVVGDGLDVVDYAEVVAGSAADRWVHRFEYDRENPASMRSLGLRGLQRVREMRRVPNDVYRCGPDVVHTIEPASRAATATFVVQGRDHRSTAPVYRVDDDPVVLPRRPLTVAELVYFVNVVLHGLPLEQPRPGSSPRRPPRCLRT